MTPNSTDAWIRAAFERHYGRLCDYAVRILGDRHGAADAAQEAFLRLCRAQPARVEHRVAEWLYTVTRHCALDALRRRKRSHEQPIGGPDPAAPPFSGEDTPEGILTLLSTPPETEREVLFLKFQSGLSYREIGAVTGHSVSYVGYRIHTGIKALRAAHAARIAAEPSRNGHAHGRPALLSPASNRLSALR